MSPRFARRLFAGGRTFNRDFQETGTAPDREESLWGRGAVEVAERADLFSVDDKRRVRLRINQVAGDVGDAVAEAIDVNNSAFYVAVLQYLGCQRVFQPNVVGNPRPETFRLHAFRQGGRDRSEDVAPVKGRAWRGSEVFVRCYMKDLTRRLSIVDVSEDPVVWSNKELLTRLHNNRSAR